MNIIHATEQYEALLKTQINKMAEDLKVKEKDLEEKHQLMSEGPFPFLRATFYRWVQVYKKHCSSLLLAPVILSVGDLHVENFGTWRDKEGRLIWGINDFDEAFNIPYTSDLVRLATSALLAIDEQENRLSISAKDACREILDGYTKSLENGGKEFILAEDNEWFWQLALENIRTPVAFWHKLNKSKEIKENVPKSVIDALESLLPEKGLIYQIVNREAGIGSRGRPRFTMIADWQGGKIAREAKPLLPSAYLWERQSDDRVENMYSTIFNNAIRVQDPFLAVKGDWVVRRLSPDCCKIDLKTIADQSIEEKLLWSMGWELGNVHLGSKNMIEDILFDLRGRDSDWLHQAAQLMAQVTIDDWKQWRHKDDE